jgi:WD40 repeat protein
MVGRRCFSAILSVFFLAALLYDAPAQTQDKPPVEVTSQLGHSSAVWTVAYSPDGQFVLSGSQDYTMKLWAVATGREVRTFSGHTSFVSAVQFSPDGLFALSGSWDHSLKLWEVATGREVRGFAGHTAMVEAVSFSPDGRFALSSSQDASIRLWDIAKGQEVRSFTGHGSAVWSVTFSPDGRTALSASADRTLKLWDAETGQLLRSFTGHKDGVWDVAFSPDGRLALSGSSDRTLKLWDVATGREIRTFTGHTDAVRSVGFSPGGRQALSGSGGVSAAGAKPENLVKLWDVETGKELRSFAGHDNWVRAVAFSPDGLVALSGSQDATLKRWDLSDGLEIGSFSGHMGWVRAVAFASPDGRIVLSGNSDNNLYQWDLATGKKLRDFKGHTGGVTALAVSRDGRLAISSGEDKALRLWDATTGTPLRTLAGHTGRIESVAFSPDGSQVLSGGGRRDFSRRSRLHPDDLIVKLWDTSTGEQIRSFPGHKDDVNAVAFSPDGRLALSASGDRITKIWDLSTGQELRSLDSGRTVEAAAFSPDGRTIISGGWDNVVRLWEVESGNALRSFTGHRASIKSVAFSADGQFALSGSLDDTMKLWEVATGRLVRSFAGHTGGVYSVQFAPDGRSVLSGSLDGTTRIWSAETGEERARMMAASDGEWLTITPKGFFAASPKGADMLGISRGMESYSMLQFQEHLARPDLVAEQLKGDLEGKYRSAANVLNLETILESGSAPRLERLYNRDRRDGGTVKLGIRLTDRGGGIGDKVVWRVNNVAQGTTTASGPGGPATPGSYVVMEQTLRLDPTERNEVEIAGYNGRGLLATMPLRIIIDPVFGITEKPTPRLFVLAVGVDKYLKPDWRLSYAVNDAKSIGEALKTVGGAFFGEDKVQVTTVLDENATEAGIGAAFDAIADKIAPQDVFVLFLSGHGRAIAGTGPGTGWFFLPQNLNLGPQTIAGNAIGSAKLEAWLRRVSALKSIIVLDACESGAFDTTRGNDLENETTIAQFSSATGRNTISAAAAGRPALEGYQGHGILTYALLEALNKKDDDPGDERVNLLTVVSHVSRRVPQISNEAFGVEQSTKTKLGDDFTFGLRRAVLKPQAIECQLPPTDKRPSHIVNRPVDAREKPADDAAVTRAMTRNSFVTLKACAGNWALIEAAGKDIGYVPLSALEAGN